MRDILNMNFDWKFHDGEIEEQNFDCIHSAKFKKPQWLKAGNNGVAKWGFNDKEWNTVNLPHDFVINRCEFSHMANPTQGCLVKGIAWYRKVFEIPKEDEGKFLSLEFDGIYRNSSVWLNGHYLGSNLSGYTSFSINFTDVANYGGINVLAIRVDATECEGWWYEGGGIYRNVRLVKTMPLHIPQYGTFVKTALKEDGEGTVALVSIETDVVNEYENKAEFEISSYILDSDGSICADVTSNSQADANNVVHITQLGEVRDPKLWSIKNPYLYTLITVIKKQGKTVDEYKTVFGIRTIEFDAQKGFILNGENVKIKGVCCHEDHAGVGVAVPYAVNEYRIKRLKEMGCNAYRTSHNPPTPEILDICDRLGMIVLDETRLTNTSKEYMSQLDTLIRRDRNHPCVVMWSLGNEEMKIQGTSVAVCVLKRMQKYVKTLDPTRPCTYGMNGKWAEYTDFHEEHGLHLDVQGFNYMYRNWDSFDKFHKKYPHSPFIGSENCSTLSTRGLYTTEMVNDKPLEIAEHWEERAIWKNEKRKGIVSAYGETFPVWGSTPEEEWKIVADRPFVSGLFVWTGFDYRGETSPYEWPSVISRFGIMDLCGFAKDIYYYYKAWWTNEDVLHIFPHWNWEGHEGEVIDVWAFTNMDNVELFINDKSLGIKGVERNGHIDWPVTYEKGKLTAKGYRNGKEVMQTEIETTGVPAKILLKPDRHIIKADNEDVCVVEVAITDEQERLVANANNEIQFTVSSNGKIIGTGNGNPLSHEHDKKPERKIYHGLCQVLIQSKMESGIITLTAKGEGIQDAVLDIKVEEAKIKPFVRSVGEGIKIIVKTEPKEAADGGV